MDNEAMRVRGYLAEQGKRALALLLCCTITWTSFPAWAQVAPTANPGGQTPGQQVAANGVPVVDIVAPTHAAFRTTATATSMSARMG